MRVTVHNVSDHPLTSAEPVALLVGGQRVRPGKSIVVDDSVLNGRHRAMHGKQLWIGDLPRWLTRPAVVQKRTTGAPLTLQEARAVLETLPLEEIRRLAEEHVYPPVDLPSANSKAAVIARFSRAIFQPERELDPEYFFWLGRWNTVSGGFVPKE